MVHNEIISSHGKTSGFFQPKYAINAPNDMYEQEADAVAEKVILSKHIDLGETFFKPVTISSIQRKCEHCEQEEKEKLQRKEENGNESETSPSFDQYVDGLNNSGSSLPPASKTFFESRMGYDFSNVKIHTDSVAAKSAQSIHALAYTSGNNIVFNQNQFQPGTTNGDKLIAHELTHTIQQNNNISTKKIQRLTNSNFNVSGLDPELASVDNVIRFERGSSVIPGPPEPETAKLNTQALPANRAITLSGHTSEEGSASGNTTIVNSRINTVKNELVSRGHDVSTITLNPNTTDGEGNRLYRSMRIVEIVDTPTSAATPPPTRVRDCSNSSSDDCNSSFTSIQTLANTKVANALTALSTPNATTLSHITTFFGSNTAATLATNITLLQTEMGNLISAHNDSTDCRLTSCNGTCGTGAAAFVDRNVSPPKMIFCESYTNDPDPDSRANTFIHESLHATPGVLTDDLAYAHTRRIRTLSDPDKLRNTDSYVNLISILHDPTATISSPPVDLVEDSTSTPLSSTENDFAHNAIDFLEQWLITAKFTTGELYDKIEEALHTPTTWTTTTTQWYHHHMHWISASFGLTDPGTSPPFALPNRNDKIRMAGISDRYFRMRNPLWSRSISLIKLNSGTANWVVDPANRLNPGNRVEVLPSFFAMTPENAIKHLIRLMVIGMGDSPSTLFDAYGNAANNMRILSSVGP